jgi:TolB-like protein
MLRFATSVLALMLMGTMAVSPVVSQNGKPVSAPHAAERAIAVADFSGKDRELGRFIAETLLTDLAQSLKLLLAERAELHRTLTELKLQATGLTEPQQVKRVGKIVGVGHLIVGSYLIYNNQIIINARLLDVRSGRLVPGGAAQVSGGSQDILAVTHRLARQFHKRVAGAELATEEEVAKAEDSLDSRAIPASIPPPESPRDDLAPWRSLGLIPATARANDPLLERDLISLIARLKRRIGSQTETPLAATQSTAPVSRLRALTALVKLLVSPDSIAYQTSLPETLPPDFEQVPGWGKPYVGAAIDQDWWPSDRPVRPREAATWAFVGAILQRMPLEGEADSDARRTADTREESGDSDVYTGLIVDAREFSLQRTMSLRILDEDGRLVYPDPKHIPDYDFLQEKGLASYYTEAQEARRAGRRPLIVPAADVVGPGRDNLVVSNEAAHRIQEASRRGRFLQRWAVGVLIPSR